MIDNVKENSILQRMLESADITMVRESYYGKVSDEDIIYNVEECLFLIDALNGSFDVSLESTELGLLAMNTGFELAKQTSGSSTNPDIGENGFKRSDDSSDKDEAMSDGQKVPNKLITKIKKAAKYIKNVLAKVLRIATQMIKNAIGYFNTAKSDIKKARELTKKLSADIATNIKSTEDEKFTKYLVNISSLVRTTLTGNCAALVQSNSFELVNASVYLLKCLGITPSKGKVKPDSILTVMDHIVEAGPAMVQNIIKASRENGKSLKVLKLIYSLLTTTSELEHIYGTVMFVPEVYIKTFKDDLKTQIQNVEEGSTPGSYNAQASVNPSNMYGGSMEPLYDLIESNDIGGLVAKVTKILDECYGAIDKLELSSTDAGLTNDQIEDIWSTASNIAELIDTLKKYTVELGLYHTYSSKMIVYSLKEISKSVAKMSKGVDKNDNDGEKK